MANFTHDILIHFGVKDKQFIRGMSNAQTKLQAFTRAVRRMAGVLGIALGATALIRLGRNVLRFADNLQTASDTLGQTTRFLQEFRFAANQAGVDTNVADMALQRFTRRLAEARQGTGELKDTLAQYNIALSDNEGRTRKTVDVMRDLADVIKNTESPAERLRIAFKAFDSEGARLLAVLKDGGESFDEMRKRASKAIVSQENINSLNEYTRLWKEFAAISTAKFSNFLGGAAKKIINLGTAWSSFFDARFLGDPSKALDELNEKREKLLDDQKESQAAMEEMQITEKDRLATEKLLTQELDKQKSLLEKQRTSYDDILRDIEEERNNLESLQSSLQSRKDDQGKFGIKELATSNERFTGTLAIDRVNARRALALEQRAELLRKKGFGGQAIQLRGQARELRRGIQNIVEADRLPQGSFEESISESQETIRKLEAKKSATATVVSNTYVEMQRKMQKSTENSEKSMETLVDLAKGAGININAVMGE